MLLDRDGTIIVDKHYLADPRGVELLEHAAEAIRSLRRCGLRVAVVSNQSGLARSYLTRAALKAIHARLIRLLAAAGARVDGIYVCPHGPEDGCDCRKPKAGLLLRAAEALQADLQEAFVIGDKASDIAAGRRVGATTILVRTGSGEKQGSTRADYVVADLAEAAEVIRKVVKP